MPINRRDFAQVQSSQFVRSYKNKNLFIKKPKLLALPWLKGEGERFINSNTSAADCKLFGNIIEKLHSLMQLLTIYPL